MAKDSLSFSYPTTITYVYKSGTRIQVVVRSKPRRQTIRFLFGLHIAFLSALVVSSSSLLRESDILLSRWSYFGTMRRQREMVPYLLVRLPLDYSAYDWTQLVILFLCLIRERIMDYSFRDLRS